MVSFDYTNMMQEAIGEQLGVSAAELDEYAVKAKGYHSDIMLRRERGELPFFDLPDGSDVVKEVLELAEYIKENFDNLVVLGNSFRIVILTSDFLFIIRLLKTLIFSLF